MAEGYLKLFRKIEFSSVFENAELLRLWLWCMVRASYRQRQTLIGSQPYILEPGQFVFSKYRVAERLKLPPTTLYRYMKSLESMGMIGLRAVHNATIVTVLNWDTYQINDGEPETEVDFKRTTNGLPVDTIIRKEEGKKEDVAALEPSAPAPKVARKQFVPPTKTEIWDEARRYRSAKKWNVNDRVLGEWCANYWDYFTTSNWHLSNRQKMVVWQSALQRFLRGDFQRYAQSLKRQGGA